MFTIRFILLAVVLLNTTLPAQPIPGTVKDFIGINSNVGAYDKKIIGRLSKVALWMREYHRWEFYEQKSDVYGWDNKTPAFNGSAWPFHTKYVKECQKHGIQMLICVERSTSYAAATGKWMDPPYGDHDGTQEQHYQHKVEFIAQLAARYGSNAVDSSLLETADKLTGLDYVHYYEDENEPDQWWSKPTWDAAKYAKYLNAVHDGFNCSTSDDFPLLGIKNADPDAVHVMGGMAARNLDYLNKLMANTGGRVPFDVINVHHYCIQANRKRGSAPEDEQNGLEKFIREIKTWRDEHVPGMPIWLTEFGWDTLDKAGTHSYVYAGEQSQANYLLRSLFLLMGYGVGKAFIFMDMDPNSESTVQYSTCGIMTDSNHGLEPKTSYYYLATCRNVIGDKKMSGVLKYREGDPEVYVYAFIDPDDAASVCHVMWCRKPSRSNDSGVTVEEYVHQIGGIKKARVIKPVDGSETGQATELPVKNPGTEESSITIPQLSETPVFVCMDIDFPAHAQSTGIPDDYGIMSAFPNPFKSELQLELVLDRQNQIYMDIYDVTGRKVGRIEKQRYQPGTNRQKIDFLAMDLPTGVYFISARGDRFKQTAKVCHIR